MENIRGKDMKEKNASELLKSGEQRTLERLASMDIDFSEIQKLQHGYDVSMVREFQEKIEAVCKEYDIDISPDTIAGLAYKILWGSLQLQLKDIYAQESEEKV